MKVILKKTILDKLNEAYDNSPKGALEYIEVTDAEAAELGKYYSHLQRDLLLGGYCMYHPHGDYPSVLLKLEPQPETKATTATDILMRERASLAARGYPSHSNAVLGATSGRAPWATEITNPRTWC
jgi:hypothetical protein